MGEARHPGPPTLYKEEFDKAVSLMKSLHDEIKRLDAKNEESDTAPQKKCTPSGRAVFASRLEYVVCNPNPFPDAELRVLGVCESRFRHDQFGSV